MKSRKQHFIIYFIAATIVATIAIQVYWNIKNYRINKQRLINEVQIALDNGIEAYYADATKKSFTLVYRTPNDSITKDTFGIFLPKLNVLNDSLLKKKTDTTVYLNRGDSLYVNTRLRFNDTNDPFSDIPISKITDIHIQKDDSLTIKKSFEDFAGKLLIALAKDSITFTKLDTFVNRELSRKNINLSYAYGHYNKDSILIDSFNNINDSRYKLSTYASGTYLPRKELLKMGFSNISLEVLKRGLTGIILSFLLSISIIACLIYLLKTIQRQKQLAEIKNDLISNITHEFKTPIATVSTALEGIQNFNRSNDQVKTEKYLNISNVQLKKLNAMVEKLLETAALDSDKVLLNKEETNIVELLKSIKDKHLIITQEKTISYTTSLESYMIDIDPFHFENAISNLVDNAIKYGGNRIEIHLNKVLDALEITVIDNGGNIQKVHRDKIFDKFYRIPTGNKHDVKGFGIGLFYTRKIIEKHGGSIQLIPDTEHTIFKIRL